MTESREKALARLEVLVGEWDVTVRFPGQQEPAGETGGGAAPAARSLFEWTLDRQFLVQRTEVPVPEAPDSMTVISADEDTGGYTQHYYDSRGVARIYKMTLDGETWKLRRDAPGFWQRYSGQVSPDGTVIAGAWEASADGRDWKRDFGLTYFKVG